MLLVHGRFQVSWLAVAVSKTTGSSGTPMANSLQFHNSQLQKFAKTLGVRVMQDGNNNAEKAHLRQIAMDWFIAMKAGCLTHDVATFSLYNLQVQSVIIVAVISYSVTLCLL